MLRAAVYLSYFAWHSRGPQIGLVEAEERAAVAIGHLLIVKITICLRYILAYLYKVLKSKFQYY